MVKAKKAESHLKSFIEYQDKMYLPGYYLGGKISPALKAKTKVGGYLMVASGIFLLLFYNIQLFSNYSLENMGWIVPIAFASLLIIVGLKFIRLNSH